MVIVADPQFCLRSWLRVPYRPLAFVSFWVVLSAKTRSSVNGQLASYVLSAEVFFLVIFYVFVLFLFTQDERESFVLISYLRVDY